MNHKVVLSTEDTVIYDMNHKVVLTTKDTVIQTTKLY